MLVGKVLAPLLSLMVVQAGGVTVVGVSVVDGCSSKLTKSWATLLNAFTRP